MSGATADHAPGAAPVRRIDCRLVATANEALADDDIEAILQAHANRDGMERLRRLGESLARLVSSGAIAAEEARLPASHPEELEALLRS